MAVGGAIAAFNLVEPAQREVGRAQFIATSSDPAALVGLLDGQGVEYGVRSSVGLVATGTTREVEVRAFDPEVDVFEPLVELTDGRWPVADNEIAVTDRAAIDGGIGESISLSGTSFTVVGRIENPTDLDDEFALLASSLDLEDLGEEPTVEVFVAAPADSVELSAVGEVGIADFGPPPAVVAAIAVNVVAAVGLVEVALVVSASFAVAATRRSHQYALLAAAGATPRMVRAAARSIGVGIGLLGALSGALIGVAVAWVMVPGFESSVGHRIVFAVPWWTVVPSTALAVGVTAFAADSPARALARRPVVELLGAPRPRPEPVGARAAVGVAVAAVGVVALWAGFSRQSAVLGMVGAVAAPVGFVLMAPLMVLVVGRTSGRLPLAPRFAGRSLARFTEAVGRGHGGPRLGAGRSDGHRSRHFLPWTNATPVGVRTSRRTGWSPGSLANPTKASQYRRSRSRRMRLPAATRWHRSSRSWTSSRSMWQCGTSRWGTGSRVAPLVSARIDSSLCSLCDIETYGFGEFDAAGNEVQYLVDSAWLASPDLIAALGVDTDWGGATVASAGSGFGLADLAGVVVAEDSVHTATAWPRHATVPQVLYEPEATVGGPYEMVRLGWLGVGDDAFDAAMQERLIAAAGPDLLLEFHEPLAPASGLRLAGLVAGLVAAAGVAFAALTMLLAELRGDLRLLAAIGARPATTRGIAAAAGALLALAGSLLAVAIGFVPLIPLLAAGGGEYRPVVPWPALAVLVLGFPLLTAALGLAAGRHRMAPLRWENGHDARPVG